MFKRLLASIRPHRQTGTSRFRQSEDSGHEQIGKLLDEQNRLLNRDSILAAPNRQGLRHETGTLLEHAFIDLAAALQPTLSVEIGAHEASFSERLKAKCPALHAIAFEASPPVFELHAARLRLPPIEVDYRHLAISDADGSAELRVPMGRDGAPLNAGISSLLHRTNFRDGYETAHVPALSLDSALAGFDTARAVAWIDVEGAQHKVIAGGHKFFARVCAVYIEVERVRVWEEQRTDRELTEILAGFSLLPIMRDELAGSQFNQVYVRADRDVIDAALPVASRYVAALEGMIRTAEIHTP